ncbi:MAG TPA: carboxypeptidase-like regulatory domain-containing protein, partial [Pyrinomonadaceae bacterium]|nr:carboxypeptidase-like regulatory domain-containing protein [Pyrinomonadaceae bacterium]
MIFRRILFTFSILGLVALPAFAQPAATATLRGTVTLSTSGKPVHNVMITVLQLKRTVTSDDNGHYEITNLPRGKYDVVAQLDRVPDVVRNADLTTGDATLDFQIELSSLREEVTVTATGDEQAVSTSLQSVEVLGSIELAK